MFTLPWQQKITDSDTTTATAMLTYLPLKHWWDTPRFIVYIVRIYFQLLRTPGLIGFSMRANPLTKHYWTLSVWENEKAIGQYVHVPPHSNVMTNMKGKMGKTAFSSWSISEASTQLSWSEALSRST